MNAQRYCFFMKKHSQIVQFDSQIVQIFHFSSQIAIFRYIKNPCHAGDRDASVASRWDGLRVGVLEGTTNIWLAQRRMRV